MFYVFPEGAASEALIWGEFIFEQEEGIKLVEHLLRIYWELVFGYACIYERLIFGAGFLVICLGYVKSARIRLLEYALK